MNRYYLGLRGFRIGWFILSFLFMFYSPLQAKEINSSLNNQKQNSSLCKADLKRKIDTILDQEELRRSHWGILVKTLDNKRTLYELNSQKYFIPASNLKLLTTAATLIKFGANYQIKTPVYASGSYPNLSVLKIVGNGDPTFNSERLETLAQELKARGIKRIDNLIVQDISLEKSSINPTWEWEDIQFYYAPAVNKLILNENTVILTLKSQELGEELTIEWSDDIAAKQWMINNKAITGEEDSPYSVSINRNFEKPLLTISGSLAINSKPRSLGMTVVNPGEYFLNSLQFYLEKEGINVINSQVFYGESETDNLVKITNQDSNNLYAESLLNILVNNKEKDGSIDNLKQILTTLGLDANLYHLKDGSGLSRHHLVTPETLVNLLTLIATTPEAKNYRDSLPIGGVSGTIKNRFKETIVEEKVQAKTGTLSGTSALSGYLNPPNYPPLAFSIVVNKSDLKASELRKIIDEIVINLGSLKQC